MKVLKFGGSSVATADRISSIGKLIAERKASGENICIAVSAYGGSTDQLITMARMAEHGDAKYKAEYDALAARHREAIEKLLSADLRASTVTEQEETLAELADILKGVFLVKEASPRTMDLIQSFGERLSAFSIARYFSSIGIPTEFCDARQIIRTDSNFGKAKVDVDVTRSQVTEYFASHEKLQIVTGFISSNEEGLTTTLGRGGSDFTAAILANCLDAEALEIWTDVSGVLTANPRVVKNAYSIPELSYDEAMELSHFGAKVIYPPTIQPALVKSIPIYIKNTFEPEHAGSRIAEEAGDRPGIGMTGLTSISGVALLTIEGSGLVGIPGTAARFFNTLGAAEVNVIMITQASSEHSICVAISDMQDGIAKDALEHEF
ncbi:UNVERIFIED_CONTAM: hypothetical protein GTU68_000937, partial [Idotea baltica]|nr:hypothetical protein [Idotea baltica]